MYSKQGDENMMIVFGCRAIQKMFDTMIYDVYRN